MMHEVATSLWKAIKQRRITQKDADEALKSLEGMQIAFPEFNWADVSAELAIAGKLDMTTYDASYLILSEKMKAKVITADDKLFQKAKGRFGVVHLKDYV